MTLPAPGEPTTEVRYLRAGNVVATASVPGHLLELGALPRTVTLHRRADGDVDLIEDPDPRLECCGRLILPSLGRAGPATTPMDVPAPPPFSDDDVRAMWEARNRLLTRRRPATSGTAAWSALERSLGPQLDWLALADALATAGRLLSGWPHRPVPAVAWLPVDRARGRLLVSITDRSPRSHVAPAGATGAPAQTARRITTPQERTLHALAAVSALVGDRIAALTVPAPQQEIRDQLAGRFRQVAHRSRPRRPVADPAPSAWPPLFTSTYSACLRVLSTLHDAGPGTSLAPLSEVWELYESWVVEQTLTALEGELGNSGRVAPVGSCIGHWADGAGQVELHYQPQIPTATTPYPATLLGQGYVTVLGSLQPDALLLRREATLVRSAVIEAKKRTAVMDSEDFTLHASKYLWGIRHADAPAAVPAISGTAIVAPLGGPTSALPGGKAGVLTAHPTTGWPPKAATALLDLVRGTPPPPASWHAPWT